MKNEWRSRSATSADYEHFARFFVELGVGDSVPDRVQWEAEIAPCALFLEAHGMPIAYAMAIVLNGTGYVHHVVVHPEWRGHRVGGALMAVLAERLRKEGCSRWCLNVKVDNTPALRLYERCGMRRAYASTSLSFAWDQLDHLPPAHMNVEARTIEPTEDAALEATFHMTPGRLANLRAQEGRVLLRLVDVAHPNEVKVGVACFDPAFPGAFPFLVERPALAAPLLRALHPHTRTGDTHVKLMIEDHVALTTMLREAGATLRFELLHLQGEIPVGS